MKIDQQTNVELGRKEGKNSLFCDKEYKGPVRLISLKDNI